MSVTAMSINIQLSSVDFGFCGNVRTSMYYRCTRIGELLCDILNKCLLQYSIVSPDAVSNWTVRTPNEPNILPTPSLHVKKVLELYPNIVQMVDKDNRLPLHYATTSNTVSFEVITEVFEASKQAASIREPISGLFPFQLAASIGNHKASFSLLLANPSLVSTGIKDNDRKRKRNTSSP
jgi:hypothetical protein